MSTIPSNDGQKTWINRTTFQTGDSVRALSGPDSGKTGVVVKSDGLVYQLIPDSSPPAFAFLPTINPPLPSAVPASPVTSFVNVQWSDGTASTIALALLGKP